MDVKILKLLEDAGAENLWPRFVGEVDGVRDYIADVYDGEVLLTAHGEAFVAQAKKAKGKKVTEAPPVDPVPTDPPPADPV